MQTFEDIRVGALIRVSEFTDYRPTGTQAPYRRIGIRQQELFADATHENPEYAGQCAIGTVDSGAVALTSMSPPVATPERITKIIIKTVNGSTKYKVGDEITIVPVADPDGIPPRAYLRNKTLIGVDGELDGVGSIEMFYPYRPEPTSATEDGTRLVEIADPYSELLVVDLAEDYLAKALQLDQKIRDAIIALFKAEETDMHERWLQHVREYAPIQSRFAMPPQAPVPRTRRAKA